MTLDSIVVETAPAPLASVIWMHGLGADGNDFVPIVPELRLPPSLPVRFVFPHAPMQPVTLNHGYVMRAWFDVAFGDLEGRSRSADEPGLRRSIAAIEELIAREVEAGIAPSRIVLAGFSQGGALALETGLRHAAPLAGLMALSTYLPLGERTLREASDANRAVPILMAHGSQDPVIGLELAVRSRDLLRAASWPVEWHEYRMPHSVCAEEIAEISAWLQRVLGTR
jgi:phospholipase/carboxylesterase